MRVTELARNCGLSRSAVLYYESIGLLKRPPRTDGNYRRYGDKDLARLRQICLYRDAGLTLADIRALVDGPENDASAVLKRRLAELSAEIEALRGHQHAILRLLRNQRTFGRRKMITKEKWIAVMRASGFSKDDMERWHTEFERSAPEEHQEFLEFLHIPADEIRQIRESSRKAQMT